MSLKNNKILVSGPSITDKEIKYISQAAENGWRENSSKYTSEFEFKMADYLGMRYALAVNSCTAAMHLALSAAGIGKGDEVIIPDITWISTAAAVSYVGATPIFADIDKNTWCIDPASIEKNISLRTKAVIPVHLYGYTAEMKTIKKIAKKNKILVIEDAAESIGGEQLSKKSGSFGDFSCFSFHGSKLLVTGEGGMLLTNNNKYYKRAKKLASDGRDSKKLFWNTEVAFHYKMSNLQAALGTVQLSRIDDLLEKKRNIFKWYKERLGNVEGVQINFESATTKNTFWMITIIIDKKYKLKKEKLIEKLLGFNIEARPFFYPLSSMPPFKNNKIYNKVAYTISPYGINLPSGLHLEKKDVDYVCNKLLLILKKQIS